MRNREDFFEKIMPCCYNDVIMPAKMTGKPVELLSYRILCRNCEVKLHIVCLRMDSLGIFFQDIFILLHILIEYK